MEIRVNVPDEIVEKARSRGVQPEAYVEEILAREIEGGNGGGKRPRTPEEFQSWLDSLAQFSDKIPRLPEVITREWIYQDHD
jgi:hypothetical protein